MRQGSWALWKAPRWRKLEGSGANPFREQRDDVKRTFESVVERTGVSAGWRDTEGPIAGVVSVYGRFSDLIIAGQDAEKVEPGQSPPGLQSHFKTRSIARYQ